MIAFPLYYLLIPFGILYLIVCLFFFFNVFHLKRYAVKSPASTMVISTYLISFGLMTLLIVGYIFTVDWTEKLTPADLMPDFTGVNRL